MSLDEILRNWFTHHPPQFNQPERYQGVRNSGLQFAKVIVENVPPSEEREEALKHIRSAVMWANAGIACVEASIPHRTSRDE